MIRTYAARPLLVGLALALVVGGCGAAFRTPEKVLEEQLEAFHADLLWGRFEDASEFVAAAEREHFLGMHEELGSDYDVTEFELRAVDVERGGERATVEVWMQYYRLPSTRVFETTYRETWEYDGSARVWQLTDREELESN